LIKVMEIAQSSTKRKELVLRLAVDGRYRLQMGLIRLSDRGEGWPSTSFHQRQTMRRQNFEN
jgi:hypothetical protein